MSKVKRFNLEERYGYQNRKVIYDKNADNDIELNNIYLIIDLFNQLDEQIAELKQQLERHNKYFNSFSCDSFDEFAGFISTFMLTPHEEQTLIKDLKKQLEEKEKMLEEYKKCNCKECMTDYEKNLNQIIDKYLYENISLKQQLKTQPAEIVEKIMMKLPSRCYGKNLFKNILKEVLKEYMEEKQ